MKYTKCATRQRQSTDPVYPPDEGDGDEFGSIPDEWEDSESDPNVFPLMAREADASS